MALFKTENAAGDVLDVTDLNFAGDGVTVTIAGTAVAVTIPGNPPSGSVGSVQYKSNPVTFAGAANVDIDNGDLMLNNNPTPVAPAAGNVKIFCEDVGGRKMLGQLGPAGTDFAFQPILGVKQISWYYALGNGQTTASTFGLVGPTVQGTATARAFPANTFTMANTTRRLAYLSAATAGSAAGIKFSTNSWWRGNAAGLGGFTFVCRFMISDTTTSVSGAQMFVGLSNGILGVAAAPTTLLNCIGIGQIAASTNLQLINNDATATGVATDLGASFPANTTGIDLYEVALYCQPNGTSITWALKRLNTGASTSGTVSTRLSVNTASSGFMAPQISRNNGATAAAVGIDIVSIYLETDY